MYDFSKSYSGRNILSSLRGSTRTDGVCFHTVQKPASPDAQYQPNKLVMEYSSNMYLTVIMLQILESGCFMHIVYD